MLGPGMGTGGVRCPPSRKSVRLKSGKELGNASPPIPADAARDTPCPGIPSYHPNAGLPTVQGRVPESSVGNEQFVKPSVTVY
jgi:hypothetical protein